MTLTHQRLTEVLDYNPDTGEFRWKVSYRRAVAGNLAGCICSHEGYRIIRIDKTNYRANRLAVFYITGQMPEGVVDHKNRVRHDDRYANLREASITENCRNAKVYKSNKSGAKGVHYRKDIDRYYANIRINGKLKHLGSFTNLEDAERVSTAARKQAFGDFFAQA